MTTQSDILETQVHWYVVHTYSGQEDRVCRNLENRIDSLDVRDKVYRVVVPTKMRSKSAPGRSAP